MPSIERKHLLITGVAGTLGRELLRQALAGGAASVTGFDIDETGLFFLDRDYRDDQRVRLFIGDIRHPESCRRHARGADIVFHTAALKQVELCERSPEEVHATNVDGLKNVIAAASAENLERMVFTSTDKAVEPAGVMGRSKREGERLIHAAASAGGRDRPVFCTVRFGNVLGSSGSVIPLFERQIRRGGPLCVTDPAMTRFAGSARQVVRWVLDVTGTARGGEIFVMKMPALALGDLAEAVIALRSPRGGPQAPVVELCGPRPGEKSHESLLGDDELARAADYGTFFVVGDDASDGLYGRAASGARPTAYRSDREPRMTHEELCRFLEREGLAGDAVAEAAKLRRP